MNRSIAAIVGLALSALASAQTLTVPSFTVTVTQGSATATAVVPAVTVPVVVSTTAPPVTTPPPVTAVPPPVTAGLPSTCPTSTNLPANPDANGTYWVQHNGKFFWQGTYSWLVALNCADTAGISPGDPVSGPTDLAVTTTGAWGGWQPFFVNFNTAPYKYLIFSIKPTRAEIFGNAFDANNDTPDGPNGVSLVDNIGQVGPGSIYLASYGPTPMVVGKWNSYKIPLSAFQFNNPLVLKFDLAAGSGAVGDTFYVDDVGFTVN